MLAAYYRSVRGGLLVTFAAWLLLACSAPAADEPATAKSIDGIWQGSLKTGAFELRVVFHIGKDRMAWNGRPPRR